MTNFYPELGASAPASALIVGHITAGRSASVYYVKWTEANHTAVLTAFAEHKLSAKNVDRFVSINGDAKWSAHMSMKAYAKAQAAGIAATECLLD